MSDINTDKSPTILTGDEALEFVRAQHIGSTEIVGNLALYEVISMQSNLPDVSVAIYDVFSK
jgi:hypothetical protein